MPTAERALVWLLRLHGFVLLLALPAVVMPTAWMDHWHRTMGLGELPRAPLVEYLTRSLSALYASLAPIYLLAASDVRRYRPLVVLLAIVHGLFGGVLLVLDAWVEMPIPWLAAEGPVVVVLAGLVLLLVRRVPV